ncbi:MAG: restriction endonuclease subunit S, partial [Rhodococcus sp. (in: high G+C Gram-positive bacteria)]|uniref:restriction endonuclease subunit S n=1 Tax=Rhodococcus sp. TaxID=1831 RepID=UPI003BB16D3E
RRIAAILDHADALRSKRREALTQLDELTQSIFIAMFEDQSAYPVAPLSDLADVSSGLTKGRKLRGAATREVPYMAVLNVQDKALNLSTVKTIEATEAEINRYRLQYEDLLLTEGGDPDKLGRGTLWRGEIAEAIHQNHIFRVRIHSENLNATYLNWTIGSRTGKAYFLKSAKQTTGIASINSTQLKSFPVPLPPIAQQKEFAEKTLRVEEAKTLHRAALSGLDSLFASLQSRAFRGEL